MAGKIFRGEYPFRLPVHLKATRETAVEITGEIGVYDGVYDGVHDGVYDGVYDEISETARRILSNCSDPISTPELLKILGYASRVRNFREALADLLQKGVLEMTIPDAPRSKKQKYRLTDQGREVVRNIETRL